MIDIPLSELFDGSFSNSELAIKYGVSERHVQRVRARRRSEQFPNTWIPSSTKEQYITPPRLDSDGVLILADIHAGYHDSKLLHMALRFQEKWHIVG